MTAAAQKGLPLFYSRHMTRIHAFGDDCLADLDAVGLAQSIAKGEVSALEATEAAIARIDKVNPTLNAVAHDDRDRALLRAKTLAPKGVFAGVPSAIKNNTEYGGIPTTHGSAAVPPIKAVSNEPFTNQLISTGVNIVGATTLPAFGLTASTEFVDRDPTVNPWNPAYSAGASSGGSAALVAAGALPIAHANDGGGSIRIPAASCGLVGLKPTRDRTKKAAMAASLPVDLISNGVVTRSVRDTAHFMHGAEQYQAVHTMPPIGLVEGPAKRRLRIGLVTESIVDTPLDAETLAAVNRTAEVLAAQGHEIIPMAAPIEERFIEDFVHYWGFLAFGIDYLGKVSISPKFDRSKVDPLTHGIAQGFVKKIWRTPATIRALAATTAKYRAVFDDLDLVMSPTLSHTTPELGYLNPGVEFEEAFRRLVNYVAFTPLNNATGGPAISLPLVQSDIGLPIGIHFSADHGRERMLLEIAYELEAAMPFARIQD